jgi:RNA polymerase sigma factor (sigma-70 family)
VTDPELQRTIEVVFRREGPRVVAGLTRLLRDVGLAEQFAQDAFVAALEQWPASGLPDNPGAWLMAAARRRAIDQRRHEQVEREHEPAITTAAEARANEGDPARAAEDEVGDDLLRLVFLCCHPALPPEARTALTLRLVAGLTTAEIARAYLLPEATIAQRIVRAKRTLGELGTPFELPGAEQRAARLGSVLEVVYLVFNEGYAGTEGGDWMRTDLGEEALRLSRVLAGLAPDEPEVHGLQALLELQASRFGARTDAGGAAILLRDQDRSRWDRVLITRGLDALARARASGRPAGSYELQASIAACHARAPAVAETDWPLIVRLYGELLRLSPSPVVELNRAIAVGMAFGAAAGLHLVDELAAVPELEGYHLLPAARGDLLHQLGRTDAAAAAFPRAAAAAGNDRERELLLARAKACASAARG